MKLSTVAKVSKKPAPMTITSAGEDGSLEQSSRQRRYFFSMMIRTVCFVLAIFLPSPYRWISLALSLVLPYISVLIANAGRESIFVKSETFQGLSKTKEIK